MSAIDIVYVHAPDRLARSYAHQVVLIEEFTRAGVLVIFHNRPIGDTPEDTLLLQLQGIFAEYERTRLLERSRRGKRHRAQEGSVSALGRAPYGFHYVSRDAGDGVARFEIDEDQARVVRGIFDWVGAERLSLAAVCRRLAAAAIPVHRQGAVEPGDDPHLAAKPCLRRPGDLRPAPEYSLAGAAPPPARPWRPAQVPLAADTRGPGSVYHRTGAGDCR